MVVAAWVAATWAAAQRPAATSAGTAASAGGLPLSVKGAAEPSELRSTCPEARALALSPAVVPTVEAPPPPPPPSVPTLSSSSQRHLAAAAVGASPWARGFVARSASWRAFSAATASWTCAQKPTAGPNAVGAVVLRLDGDSGARARPAVASFNAPMSFPPSC